MDNHYRNLDIVIPIYNEEECIPLLVTRLAAMHDAWSAGQMRVIFVNDGSSDGSLDLLRRYAIEHGFIRIIKLSRNFGHQYAVTAGLDHVDADCAAIIDADLQDPPELIADFFRVMKERRADVVYGRRIKRTGESFFKLVTAKLFYRLIRFLCRVDIPADTGDFRLINQKVLAAFKRMPERHRFIRGMIPWTGFKSVAYDYERGERVAGHTKYPFRKMVEFAVNAILSFSNAPLRLAIYIGTILVLCCAAGGGFLIYLRLFTKYAVPGITATILTIIMMGGIQVFMLGIIGEYIGRIFEETKRQPLYIIEEVFGGSGEWETHEAN